MIKKTAINKLTRAIGRATLVASSKNQVALGGIRRPWGPHVHDAGSPLKGKAVDNQGRITINGMATFVEETLPQITYKEMRIRAGAAEDYAGDGFPHRDEVRSRE